MNQNQNANNDPNKPNFTFTLGQNNTTPSNINPNQNSNNQVNPLSNILQPQNTSPFTFNNPQNQNMFNSSSLSQYPSSNPFNTNQSGLLGQTTGLNRQNNNNQPNLFENANNQGMFSNLASNSNNTQNQFGQTVNANNAQNQFGQTANSNQLFNQTQQNSSLFDNNFANNNAFQTDNNLTNNTNFSGTGQRSSLYGNQQTGINNNFSGTTTFGHSDPKNTNSQFQPSNTLITQDQNTSNIFGSQNNPDSNAQNLSNFGASNAFQQPNNTSMNIPQDIQQPNTQQNLIINDQKSNNLIQNDSQFRDTLKPEIPLNFINKTVSEIIDNMKKKLEFNLKEFEKKAKKVYETDELLINTRNVYLTVLKSLEDEEIKLCELEENIEFFTKLLSDNKCSRSVLSEVEELCDEYNKWVEEQREGDEEVEALVGVNMGLVKWLKEEMDDMEKEI